MLLPVRGGRKRVAHRAPAAPAFNTPVLTAADQQPLQQSARGVAGNIRAAPSVLRQDLLHPLKDTLLHDRRVLPHVRLALVRHPPHEERVRQNPPHARLREARPALGLTFLRDPDLVGDRRTMHPLQHRVHRPLFQIPAEDLADLRGLQWVHRQPGWTNVVPQDRPTARPLPPLPRERDLVPRPLAAEFTLELRERH